MIHVIAALNEHAAASSESLLRAAGQGAVAIVVAWILVRCYPRVPPRVGCWIWRLVDAKLLAALVWASPLLLPILPATSPARPERPPFAIDHGFGRAIGPGRSLRTPARSADTTEHVELTSASAVVVCWGCMVVAAAMSAAARGWRIRRLRRSCRPVDRSELRDLAAELARNLGLGIVPELKTGPAVDRPMLVGLLRPAILLPPALANDGSSNAALRSVLAHELAHVRRCDLFWSAAATLVRALFFFHPLVWLAHREALLAREAACDALALQAAGVRAAEYGRILVEVARGDPRGLSARQGALGMAGSTWSLKRRLIAMKMIQEPSRRRLRLWAWALVVVGLAGIVPWRLVPRSAVAQEPASKVPDARAGDTSRGDGLQVAEARLALAQAERKAAEAEQKAAEDDVARDEAEVERLQVEVNRLQGLVDRRVVDPQIVHDSRSRLTAITADRDAARAALGLSRASRDAANAAVSEAEALRDIARATQRSGRDPNAEAQLKDARARLRNARRDRARGERDAARAAIDRAEAKLAKADAEVARWDTEVQRLDREVKRGVVDPQILAESRNALKARQAARVADAAQIDLSKARLDVAEARLKYVAAEAEAGAPGPARDGARTR